MYAKVSYLKPISLEITVPGGLGGGGAGATGDDERYTGVTTDDETDGRMSTLTWDWRHRDFGVIRSFDKVRSQVSAEPAPAAIIASPADVNKTKPQSRGYKERETGLGARKRNRASAPASVSLRCGRERGGKVRPTRAPSTPRRTRM